MLKIKKLTNKMEELKEIYHNISDEDVQNILDDYPEIDQKFKKLCRLKILNDEGKIGDREIIDNINHLLQSLDPEKRESFLPDFTLVEISRSEIILKHTNNLQSRFFYADAKISPTMFKKLFSLTKKFQCFRNRHPKIETLNQQELDALFILNKNTSVLDKTSIDGNFHTSLNEDFSGIYFDDISTIDGVVQKTISQCLKENDPIILGKIYKSLDLFLHSCIQIYNIIGGFPRVSPDFIVFDGDFVQWNDYEFSDKIREDFEKIVDELRKLEIDDAESSRKIENLLTKYAEILK